MNANTDTTVIVDTCVLINLIKAGQLDLLASIAGYHFCTPNHVVEEVIREPQRTILRGAVDRGLIEEIEITDVSEMRIFAKHRSRFDPGESACMAIAINRGWTIASDERLVKKEMRARLGECFLLDTVSILVLAIRQGLLSVEQADEIKDRLEARSFKMKVRSFGDLV